MGCRCNEIRRATFGQTPTADVAGAMFDAELNTWIIEDLEYHDGEPRSHPSVEERT